MNTSGIKILLEKLLLKLSRYYIVTFFIISFLLENAKNINEGFRMLIYIYYMKKKRIFAPEQ